MSQLSEYIIALTNLYGLVHKNMVAEIHNSQNKEQVSISEVEKVLSHPPKQLEDAFIYPHDEYFVHQAIVENEGVDSVLNKKGDKPHYVPNKNELLKYIDGSYFEKPKQYIALLNYVKKYFFKSDEQKAEWLCEDIQGMCQFGVSMKAIMESFNDKDIVFDNMNQINEVMQLVMDLSNNVRIWENNGHTPNEIFEKSEQPHLNPLPSKPFDFEGTNVIDMTTRKKIGRNDPCPCGSGKKFKKCCLGKEGI